MCHRVPHGLAGGGVEPQGADQVVVAASVADPLLAVVHQDHHLVLAHVGVCFVAERQSADVEGIETLCLLQQVVDIDIVEVALREFIGRLRAVALVPIADEVLAFARTGFRPGVFAVGV